MKIEHKIFESEVKAFDDENLIVEHFISTEHKDRGGDIMRAKGMKIVGKPVVLLLHGRGPMGSEPVAKPLSIAIDEFKGQPGILARTQFYKDEVGQRLYGKVKGGFLPNWSIGYAVDEAKDLLRDGRYDGRDVTKWQLLEYSPVGVPMNPFAQTIKEAEFKEFLEKTEKLEGPFEVPESPWFGVVEEKSCTGCGACGKKHLCPTCKGDLTLFVKDGSNIGIVCEKCQPEEFARLQKEIEPPADPPPEDPMKSINEKFAALEEQGKALSDALAKVNDSLKFAMEGFAKLEPLLATLPPEPEGGDKGNGNEGNPPDGETPPLLVFRDVAKEAADRKKAEIDRVIAAMRSAVVPIMKAQVDKLMGRVP